MLCFMPQPRNRLDVYTPSNVGDNPNGAPVVIFLTGWLCEVSSTIERNQEHRRGQWTYFVVSRWSRWICMARLSISLNIRIRLEPSFLRLISQKRSAVWKEFSIHHLKLTLMLPFVGWVRWSLDNWLQGMGITYWPSLKWGRSYGCIHRLQEFSPGILLSISTRYQSECPVCCLHLLEIYISLNAMHPK